MVHRKLIESALLGVSNENLRFKRYYASRKNVLKETTENIESFKRNLSNARTLARVYMKNDTSPQPVHPKDVTKENYHVLRMRV